MDTFQYFHLCNHQFSTSESEPLLRTFTVQNSGDLIDILIERARLLDIIEIRVLEYPSTPAPTEFEFDNTDDQNYEDVDAQDGYFDDDTSLTVDYRNYFTLVNGAYQALPLPRSFYSPYLHNRIRWNVKPPNAYVVTAKVVFSASETVVYNRNDCPRCQGQSWYVDLVNTTHRFVEAAGIEFVAQRIIKDLFTEFGSNTFDATYGTLLRKQILQLETDDEGIFNYIRATVADVQNKYLFRQAPLLTNLPSTQRLVSLSVGNIERMAKSPFHIIVDLVIQTETTTQSLRVPLFGGGN